MSQPPFDFREVYRIISGSAPAYILPRPPATIVRGHTDVAASFATAVKNAGAFGGPFGGFNPYYDRSTRYAASISRQRVDSTDYYAATYLNIQWRWSFYTATCFFKIWWRQVYRDGSPNGGIELGSSDHVYTWTPTSVAGLCLPEKFTQNDPATWPQTDAFTLGNLTPPAAPFYSSRIFGYIDRVRYSLLPDYVPPADGSANGFPT